MDDFAGYLHNPFGYPTEREKDAIKKMSNKLFKRELLKILKIFFGDRQKNESEGLSKQYNKLKEHVIREKLIGMFLWGADRSNDTYDIVSIYTASDGTDISLTCNSICYNLLREYIKSENIEKLCLEV